MVDHNISINRSVYDNYFFDPVNFDFRLKSSATAINTGSPDLAPLIDITQATRDATPDIGAYEYISSGDVTPPAPPTGLSVL